MTILTLLLLAIFYILDKNTKKILFGASALMFIPLGMSYDLRDTEEFSMFFIYNKPEMQLVYFYVFGAISIGLALSFCCANLVRKKVHQMNLSVYILHSKRVRFLYYFLSVVSISAFLLNFQRVGFSIDHLFIAPREYEYEFGRYFAINYLYFLNVPAFCLYIFYRRLENKKLKYSYLINSVLIMMSFFHGIKFTIFDTVLIPVFFTYLLYYEKKVNWKKIALIIISGAIIFNLFMIFVRGGTGSIIINSVSYILPNYYNFIYTLEHTFFTFDPLFNLFIPDKIVLPLDGLRVTGPTGFILNDKYNMYTGFFSLHASLNIFGPLLLLPLLFVLIKKAILNSTKNLSCLFLATMLSYCLIYMFYFWAFTKTKFWYYVFVFILADIFIRRKKIKTRIV